MKNNITHTGNSNDTDYLSGLFRGRIERTDDIKSLKREKKSLETYTSKNYPNESNIKIKIIQNRIDEILQNKNIIRRKLKF